MRPACEPAGAADRPGEAGAKFPSRSILIHGAKSSAGLFFSATFVQAVLEYSPISVSPAARSALSFQGVLRIGPFGNSVYVIVDHIGRRTLGLTGVTIMI